ncbi:zinc finger BED domain-containing protein RICESLEEPER 2-like [Chenopodium quinoa]|uniref:zinc finger BED domain-containing protein RICESLEEPER 2-like n=1 Tax=Chenopodium quinoa TaxID=63459 RepID=UPI000B78FD81|nr:zinc finger BED domain-containing protein RICESLEEPER 2-like [Chenopodium quinoa]
MGDFEVEQASITCMNVGNATPTLEPHQSISPIQGKRSLIWQNFEINGEHAACKFCKRLIQKHSEHDVLKQYVCNTFKALSSKVSLTCDVWTTCTTRGYLSLTAHFVDDLEITVKVLNFRHIPPPHNGHEIYNLVFRLIKDWGIERKICSMTIDNASNTDSMVGKLQIELDAMAKLPLDVRENVKYVDSSEARLIRFERCVSSCNLATGVKLWMDVPTRWNFTFLMLRRALDLLLALKMFGRIESNYHLALTAHEWEIEEKMCDFLEPFYDITNLFSGSEYPTSNLYVANICRIESLLVAASKGDDPKLKENGRSYALQDLYEAHMVETKVQEVYYEFVQLFNHYKDPLPTYSSQGSSNSDAYRPRKTSRVYANFVADVASGDMGKSELELYLELPLKPCNVDEEFDILAVGRSNQQLSQFLDDKELECAHLFVLRNTGILGEYERKFEDYILSTRPFLRREEVMENFEAEFSNWFHHKEP